VLESQFPLYREESWYVFEFTISFIKARTSYPLATKS